MIKRIVLVLLVMVIPAIGYQMWKDRDIPFEILKTKYGYPHSQFMEVDGVNFHVLDEGPKDGEAVVLIHGHFGSLHMYDGWADVLKDTYRVVRFDMTSHGLTGPDPSGDYTRERTIHLAKRLFDKLGLDTFHIGGTSMGGSVALWYTFKHPEQVLSLTMQSHISE